jgi:hypothetical protein
MSRLNFKIVCYHAIHKLLFFFHLVSKNVKIKLIYMLISGYTLIIETVRTSET